MDKKGKKHFLVVCEIRMNAIDRKSARAEVEKCIPRALKWGAKVKVIQEIRRKEKP